MSSNNTGTKVKRKQINLRVDPEIAEALRQEAFDKRISQNKLLIGYVKEGLTRDGRLKDKNQAKLD